MIMETKTENYLKEIYSKYFSLFEDKNLPKSKSELEHQGFQLKDIVLLAENLKSFLSLFPEDDRDVIILKITDVLVKFGSAHQFSGEERDYGPKDFPRVAENAELSFEALAMLLEDVVQFDRPHQRQFLTDVMLLCGTHSSQQHWSSSRSVEMCRVFLDKLLSSTKHDSLQSLLCDEEFFPTIFKSTLKVLHITLLKDRWMNNPSITCIFFWLLSNVKHPHLEKYFDDVSHPPLLFIHHFSTVYKVLGIQCFSHILDNVPPFLFKIKENSEQQIMESFRSLMHTNEREIVQILYPCFLKLPSLIHDRFCFKSSNFWDSYDVILSHLIMVCERESNVSNKAMYLSHIHNFVDSSPPFKHLKALLRILDKNAADDYNKDLPSHINSLKILRSIIQSCWPRIEFRALQIFHLVMKTVEELDNYEDGFANNDIGALREVTGDCVFLLRDAATSTFCMAAADYMDKKSRVAGPGYKIILAAISEAN